MERVIQSLKTQTPFLPRVSLLHWRRSAHLLAQNRVYSWLAISSSIRCSGLARLSLESARNLLTRSGLGGAPVKSKETRRTNSASVHTLEGRIFIFRSFASTFASTKLYSGASAH